MYIWISLCIRMVFYFLGLRMKATVFLWKYYIYIWMVLLVFPEFLKNLDINLRYYISKLNISTIRIQCNNLNIFCKQLSFSKLTNRTYILCNHYLTCKSIWSEAILFVVYLHILPEWTKSMLTMFLNTTMTNMSINSKVLCS